MNSEYCFRYFVTMFNRKIKKIYIIIILKFSYFCNDQIFFIYWQNDNFRLISYFFHNDSHLKKILKTIFQIFTSTMSNFGVFDLQLEVFNIIISDFYYFHNEQSFIFCYKIFIQENKFIPISYHKWFWYLFITISDKFDTTCLSETAAWPTCCSIR